MSEFGAHVGEFIRSMDGDVNQDVYDTIHPLWLNKEKLTQREKELVYALGVLANNQLILKNRLNALEAKTPVAPVAPVAPVTPEAMAGGAKKRSKKATTAKKTSKKASKTRKTSKKGNKTTRK